jgi:hypothetical protein
MQLRSRDTASHKKRQDIGIGYPDLPPSSAFESMVAALNRQSFPAIPYARVDDMVVYGLFATKRRDTWSRSLNPLPVGTLRRITRLEGIEMRHICKDRISKSQPTAEECHTTAHILSQQFPHLFEELDASIVEQYVINPVTLFHISASPMPPVSCFDILCCIRIQAWSD